MNVSNSRCRPRSTASQTSCGGGTSNSSVSELLDPEVIVYANPEFERVSGLRAAALDRRYWDVLDGEAVNDPDGLSLVDAILERSDRVGTFKMPSSEEPVIVDLHSNLIEDDAGIPTYRLVALVNAVAGELDSHLGAVSAEGTNDESCRHVAANPSAGAAPRVPEVIAPPSKSRLQVGQVQIAASVTTRSPVRRARRMP